MGTAQVSGTDRCSLVADLRRLSEGWGQLYTAHSSPVPICALNRSCSRVTRADRMSMPRRTTCNGKHQKPVSGGRGRSAAPAPHGCPRMLGQCSPERAHELERLNS